ncbi:MULTISPECIES: hypothetical protein [unclassified Streptomyces]|uniref:hypothetical protein n=1 Tax=unclassified Streptomyces TaxID=2593676 RepID=UPI0022581720|nr:MULTISPECIES: hypothetical protein [unclassified Streptomyces]MCX4650261.1 hypothetical protein [Streptomyces sp. NBC_01446]MCX5323892.1 hypothetical protein [Streptomyces sp. NBC_00120]MCX5327742.1 hypothetical protein [Streptomyces sp. NBC_00120]
MAFAEDFAAALSQRGIQMDPVGVPAPDVIGGALDNIDGYISQLDDAVRQGFDEGSLEFPVCSVLADPTVNVAPEISSILAAYDRTSNMRLTEMLRATHEALEQVGGGVA